MLDLHSGIEVVRQVRMQLRDHVSAFADRGTDTLDRSRTHVANGENAGDVRFKRQRLAVAVECCARQRFASRLDKTPIVELHRAILQPLGCRIRTEKEKDIPNRVSFLVSPRQWLFELALAQRVTP